MKSFKFMFLVVISFITNYSFTQTILEGNVTNINEKPVENVMIYFDSIYSNVKTNKQGYFKVTVPENVDYINAFSRKYGLLSSPYAKENIINFVYLNKIKKQRIKRNDQVNIGYDEKQKKFVVHSIDAFDAERENDLIQYQSIYDMIRGRVPGVTVTRSNKIIVRGVNSVRNVSEPLFVVDGTIVSSLDYLFPSNVKDINVLKGSADSMYGAQGAGGVIVITTKSNN